MQPGGGETNWHKSLAFHAEWGYGSVVGLEVREATPDDLDWLIQELRAFSAFYTSKLSLFPADDSGPRAKMLDLINNQFVSIAEIRNHAQPEIGRAHV